MKLREFINRVKDSTKNVEIREATASGLHELSQRSFLKTDGSFEKNIAITADEKWIKEHGSNQIDIASLPFRNLPEDLKEEYMSEAKVLEDIYAEHRLTIEDVSTDKKNRLFVGEIIHESKLNRATEKDETSKRYPFNKLSTTDKNKYARQYSLYLEIRKSSQN